MAGEKDLRLWGCFHFANHLLGKIGFVRDHFVGVLYVVDLVAVGSVAALRLRGEADQYEYLVAVFSFSVLLYQVT